MSIVNDIRTTNRGGAVILYDAQIALLVMCKATHEHDFILHTKLIT